MFVKYINRMASSTRASAIASAIASAGPYLQADINVNPVVPVSVSHANRKAFLKKGDKLNVIGDLEFFINWMDLGAHIDDTDNGNLVTYAGQRYYIASINPDYTLNLSKKKPVIQQGHYVYEDTIVYTNVPYESVQRVNPDNRSGVVSIPGLKAMVEKLELDVTDIQSELHSDQNALSLKYTIRPNTNSLGDKTRRDKGEDWLRDQAIPIFNKIKKFYSKKRNLGNRDARKIITKVETILDELLKVLEPIIPEVAEYIRERKRERESERERERRAEAHAPNSNVVSSSVIGNKRKNRLDEKEDEMLTKRLLTESNQSKSGGKSMKPKQHRNSKTQKKRQRKNQKK